MPITAAAITGGVGLLSGYSQQKAQQKANRMNALMNAAQTEFSPWTGIQPQGMQFGATDPMGGALAKGIEGGLAGYMQGQNIEAAKKPMPEAGQSPWAGIENKYKPMKKSFYGSGDPGTMMG